MELNISKLFDWTSCSLQVLRTLIQKEEAQHILTQGDSYARRSMFPIPKDAWIANVKPNVTCTSRWCSCTVTCYIPVITNLLCSFHVLPIIKRNYFLQPCIEGAHIGNNNNSTYKLTDRISTDKGFACNGLFRMMESCLLSHSVNLCTLTIFPIASFSVLYEIEPQRICLASSNAAKLAAMGLPSPFSGCLQHLELLHWNGMYST